jgi:hypothetical protein
MWTKLKIVEPIDYIQGDLIRENVAEEDGKIWTRQYNVEVNSGSLLRVINVINRNIRGYGQCIIEFLLEEDLGNIHAPPYTRALTNLDDKNCVIDFYYENLEAPVYFAQDDLVRIHHADFNLNWSVVLKPNETILIDATLPTRINYGRKLLWREWPVEYKEIQKRFSSYIDTDSDEKELVLVTELARRGLDPIFPIVVKKGGVIKYTKMPNVVVINEPLWS